MNSHGMEKKEAYNKRQGKIILEVEMTAYHKLKL
jgi:hypothetical protein